MVTRARRWGAIGFICVALIGFPPAQAAVGEDVISSRDLVTLRDISSLSVSPDGRFAAFEIRRADPGRNAYVADWYIADVSDGRGASSRVRRVTNSGELLLDVHQGRTEGRRPPPPPLWSPDSNWIVYLRRNEGRTHVWRSDRLGRRTEQLTRYAVDAARVVFSRDGRRILVETTPSQAQVEQLLQEEGENGFLFDRRFVPLRSLRPLLPPDAALADVRRAETAQQAGQRRLWVVDVALRRERPANDADRAEFENLIASHPAVPISRHSRHSAEGIAGRVAWTEARDESRIGARAPLTVVARWGPNESEQSCRATECVHQQILGLWWRNENELLFARAEGRGLQETGVYAWRYDDDAVRPVFHTAGRLVPDAVNWRCSVALDQLVCLFEEAASPRRLVAIDLATSVMETVFEPNPDFRRFNLGSSPQLLDIRTVSGFKAVGYLVTPPGYSQTTRLPLVIVTYTCAGFLRGGTGDEYPIYPLAAQGFAVVCLPSPEDFDLLETMDTAAYIRWSRGTGMPMQRRIEETLDEVITQLDAAGIVDPSRVAVTGLSYGAEIVGHALLHMPQLGAVIASGNIGASASGYYLAGEAAREALRDTWGIEGPDETNARWREYAFTPHLERVRVPVLLNVADSELLDVVEIVARLQEAGRPVEMRVFPGEHHVKWQPSHRLAIYEQNVDWLNFWLQSVEDATPAKHVQYQRWRRLRALLSEQQGE